MKPTAIHKHASKRYRTAANLSTIPTAARLGMPTSTNRKKTPPDAWSRLAWGIAGFLAAAALSAIAASLPSIAR